MVKTRSRNKRVTYVNESAPDEDDFEEEEFRIVPSDPPVPVSVSASGWSAPFPVVTRRSKRRKRGEQAILVSMDMFCDDVVSHVYSLLGSPRDVYSFALCSRRIYNLLTPEVVIRSAVFHGGNAAKSIKEIVKAVERKSIFVPDTPRLLRLVNGTRCERLYKCWSYDLRNGLSGKASVVCPGIGMFLCRKCSSALTTVLQRRSWSWVSKEESVAMMRSGHCHRAVNECASEAVTRNPCGPVVSLLDIRQIEGTSRDEGERRGAVQCLLEQNDGINEHVQQGDTFMEIFQKAERDQRDYYIRWYKALNAEDRVRNARKLTKMRAVFEQLESLLADTPWRQLALSCYWQDNIDHYPRVHFHCEIVRQATERLFSAPSSCSQKKLKNAAEDITRAFNLLYEKDIFSFSFLAASPDDFERGLYQYCRENVTPEMLLKIIPCDVQAWLDKVQNDNLSAAVIDTFGRTSVAFQEAFATTVVSSESIARLGLNLEKFRAVACNIWINNPFGTIADSRSNELFIRNHLNARRDQYAERETSLVDFLTSPLTTNWLERAEENYRDLGPGVEFTRQNAVDQVFTANGECSLLLQIRSFEGLLRLVERFYQRPGRYNLLPPAEL